MIIETDRLTLAELQIEDAPFILELYNDPDFIKYIGDRNIHSIFDAKKFIKIGPQASYTENDHGLYKVSLKDHTPIGICGLLKRDELDDPDIGFAMLPNYRKCGYTFEASVAVLNDGRNRLGLNCIIAITSPENKASIRLLNKLGMGFERMIQLAEIEYENKLFCING